MFLNKTYLIYGFGISGKSCHKFFKQNKIKHFIYDDFINLKLKNFLNRNNLNHFINLVDFIIISPSIRIDKSHLLNKYKKKIIIDLDILYQILPKNIITIGVTGTEGKSSTCLYLKQFFTHNNKKSVICGNYGNTILEKSSLNKTLKNIDFLIIELSSYQLFYSRILKLNFSIITNIFKDHINFHSSFKKYVSSKLRIITKTKSNKNVFISEQAKNFIKQNINQKINYFKLDNKNIIEKTTYDLFKKLNIVFRNNVSKNDYLNFKNPEFRNEKVLDKKKLLIINDSKSTNLDNSLKNIKYFKHEHIYLIIGGKLKNFDLNIKIKEKINLIVFGSMSQHENFIRKNISRNVIFFNDLLSLMKFLRLLVDKKNDNLIVFSPGGESFDLYKNFLERGRHFNKLLKDNFYDYL